MTADGTPVGTPRAERVAAVARRRDRRADQELHKPEHTSADPAAEAAAKWEREMLELIQERDALEIMCDDLAAAIAPPEVLGQHSSGNNPWRNALDYAEVATVRRVTEREPLARFSCPQWHQDKAGWCLDEGPHLAAADQRPTEAEREVARDYASAPKWTEPSREYWADHIAAALAAQRAEIHARYETVARKCEREAQSRSHYAKVDPDYRISVIPYEVSAEWIRQVRDQ